jgi:NitT/TauT family transport system substrate-binding protein
MVFKISNNNYYIMLKNSLLITFLLFFTSCNQTKLPDFVTGLNDSIGKDVIEKTQVLRKVRFMPNWNLNSQFAAYYVGKELGIFKKYGIDIEILSYNPSKDFTEEFKKNKVDFAVLWLSNAIEANKKNAEIVNIAQFSRKSSVMFVTKKKNKINRIEDFTGKKVAIWHDFQNQAKVFFKRNKVELEIIPFVNSLNLFYSDGVEIINANYFDEYNSILNSGYDSTDLTVFFMADYGVNLLEDGLYCKNSLLKTDSELCIDFANATISSWNYVFKNKDESIEIIEKIMKANNRPFNKSHQKWMLNKFEEIYTKNGKININLLEKDYLNNASILTDEMEINKIQPYSEFYKPYFSLKKK